MVVHFSCILDINVFCNAFYHPQMKLREGNVLHLSVSHSVHMEEGGCHDVTSCYKQHLQDGTPPTVNKQASYWNAFLLSIR